MKSSSSKLAKKSSGFIISLEFLLVMAIVVMPLLIGFFLLGRKVITLVLNEIAMVDQPLSKPVVWDSSVDANGNAKPVGPVIGYDQFESPLVLYRDNTPPFDAGQFKPGALLGVRPNRFTTISRVYYDAAGCTGNAYVKAAASSISSWPMVGFLSQTQGINYAVGNGNALYRESTLGTAGGNAGIGSVWESQNVGDASPATTVSTACSDITGASISLVGVDDTGTTPVATGTTTVAHGFSPGDFVLIAGAGGYNGTYSLITAVGTVFTFTGPGGVGPVVGGTVTLLSTIPNLVPATCVANLGNISVCGAATNFTPPFKVAFPTAMPFTGAVGGTGG